MKKRTMILASLLSVSVAVSGMTPAFAGELTDGLTDAPYEVSEIQEVLPEEIEELTGIIEDGNEEIPETTEEFDTLPAETIPEEGSADVLTDEIVSDGAVETVGDAMTEGAENPLSGKLCVRRVVRTGETKATEEYFDDVYLHKDETTGKIYGVIVETVKVTDGKEELVLSTYWDALDGTWSYTGEDGEQYYLPESGALNLVGDAYWNIVVTDSATGATAGKGGHVLNIGNGSGEWEYYLTETDVKNTKEFEGLTEYDEELPKEFYIGVQGNKNLHSGLYKANSTDTYFLEVKDGKGTIVFNDIRTVGNIKYYFGEDGKCTKTEEIPTEKKGWVEKDGNWYWYDEDGTMATGWRTIDGDRYYFLYNGVRKRGWQTIGDKKYYFEKDGKQTWGWRSLGGKRYYFTGKDGAMKKGWQTIGDKKYYFEKDGHQTFGWRSLGGKRYYFAGKSGAMKRGWQAIDDKKYYFEKDGTQTFGWRSLGGKRYYFAGKSGAMKRGWQTIGDKKYYFEKDGDQTRGWRSLGGKLYYFGGKGGAMQRGWLTLGTTKYYFNKDGSRFTGIRSLGGKRYYFQSNNGKLLTNRKTYKIGSKYYDADANGVLKEVPKARALARKRLDATGRDLKAAFDWCAKIKYEKNSNAAADGMKEADAFAIYGFENERGDSYVMAGTFYQMAKELGYDVHYVKGKTLLKSGRKIAQGWCEIDKDGKTYVCDPYYTNEDGRSGYMFAYGDDYTWQYVDYYRVN